ncbi:hypothetical protein IV203_036212 [Nitzschia inconspicua]|uniref:Uncharacterized protein n=1 Tax=Nitzschia inconspicua TaxID=303405 RepID=A0A9K3LFJ9_9STRA|nr:hypothetical protein IV203_036212 [Nitzschia inconspicua]
MESITSNPNADSSSSPVKRVAILKKKGKGLYLRLLENGKVVKNEYISSENKAIDSGLELIDEDGFALENAEYAAAVKGCFFRLQDSRGNHDDYVLENETPFDISEPEAKRPRIVLTGSPDSSKFHSPAETELPKPDEGEWDFLEPEKWLDTTREQLVDHAKRKDKNSNRCSPIAFIRCSRGGKTRSMVELARKVREEDESYSIVFVTFNTDTPLHSKDEQRDPVEELCIRIAYAAFKEKKSTPTDFRRFYANYTVGREWVEAWLQEAKCILFVDEINLLQDRIDGILADFLKVSFVLPAGRGFVFSSHRATVSRQLAEFMFSTSNGEVILRPLPLIPSLKQARDHFKTPDLSPQEVLYLGLIPGLIVEELAGRLPKQRRADLVTGFINSLAAKPPAQSIKEVLLLLGSLLTGMIFKPLQELMTADVNEKGNMVLRWIPCHMAEAISKLRMKGGYFLPKWLGKCLKKIVWLFVQFRTAKWESGEAWEALFIIVLIVLCVTGEFDDVVVPLHFDDNVKVKFNEPFSGVDFRTKSPTEFIKGIPKDGEKEGISIYYPNHARYEELDVILACWDSNGTRSLYGYQLKEDSIIPKAFANTNMFQGSYLVRGLPTSTVSKRHWRAVTAEELDVFFGESAKHWSAKSWKRLKEGNTLSGVPKS